jgi:hypothetical protein
VASVTVAVEPVQRTLGLQDLESALGMKGASVKGHSHGLWGLLELRLQREGVTLSCGLQAPGYGSPWLCDCQLHLGSRMLLILIAVVFERCL